MVKRHEQVPVICKAHSIGNILYVVKILGGDTDIVAVYTYTPTAIALIYFLSPFLSFCDRLSLLLGFKPDSLHIWDISKLLADLV